MPFLFGGVLIVLELICIIHAARSGKLFPWIYVIVMLPAIGVIAYVVVELGPDVLGDRGVRQLRTSVVRMADPARDLRHARRTSEIVDSVEAKANLAEQYLLAGDAAAAIERYQSALVGLHHDDPMLLFGLARAQLAAGDGALAQKALDDLQAANPNFSSAEAHLVYAQALEMQGKLDDARQEYDSLCVYYPGEEARCRYAKLLTAMGATAQAERIFGEVVKRCQNSPGHYRRMQKDWLQLAKRELAVLSRAPSV